jgi:thymidylate kinase
LYQQREIDVIFGIYLDASFEVCRNRIQKINQDYPGPHDDKIDKKLKAYEMYSRRTLPAIEKCVTCFISIDARQPLRRVSGEMLNTIEDHIEVLALKLPSMRRERLASIH